MNLRFRSSAPADAPALSQLFRRAYGQDLSVDEWKWKYEANPLGSFSMVAEEEGRLAAYYGGFRQRMIGASGVLDALEVCDTMTDPAARGPARRPTLLRLHEAFLPEARQAGLAFCWGCPNAAASRLGTRWLGYRLLFSLSVLSFPLGFFAGSASPAWQRISDSFPESHDRLVDEIHARGGWRVDRSHRTLDWRYWARPLRYYRVYHAGSSPEEPEAFAVAVVVGALVQLVDLQWTSKREQALPELLGVVARDLLPGGVVAAEVALEPGEGSERLSRELGGETRPDVNQVGVRPVDDRVDGEAVLRAASLRWGDFDFS